MGIYPGCNPGHETPAALPHDAPLEEPWGGVANRFAAPLHGVAPKEGFMSI